MAKTNKSFKKRVRVTKTGKILVRKKGHGHFNAKKSREKQLSIKREEEITMRSKILGQLLPKN